MTLEERIVRLERQNRRMKVMGVTALLLGAMGIGAGAALDQPPGRIEARHFVLTDGENQVGEWYVAGEGANFLMRRNGEDRARVLFQSGVD